MLQIVPANARHMLDMQNINLRNLPENYTLKYYTYHLMMWPQLSYVCIIDEKVVGYCLGKIEEDDKHHGHITSLAVHPQYRRLGVAKKLITLSVLQMKRAWKTKAVFLHVRVSNTNAQGLYEQIGFKIEKTEKGYYQDGEDALSMKLAF
eukprot:NODE_24_length_41419_cov_0.818780.p29 type:complete len:149 gc:universal NODE_24_length_41419_cov_0.818780:16736-17182(+)